MQKIRLARKYDYEDGELRMRKVACYVNYHILLSVLGSDKMGPFIDFLRRNELSDEEKMSLDETLAEKARILKDIETVSDAKLASIGQRKMTPEERERHIANRRIQNSGRRRGPRRQGSAYPTGIPPVGSSDGIRDQTELRGPG